MNQVTQIIPVTDDEAARMVRPETMARLAMAITAMPVDVPAAARHRTRDERRARTVKRGLLAGIPLAAAAAAAAVAVAMSGSPASPASARQADPARTQQTGPAQVQALSFITTKGGGITVIVRNPLADPAVYRAEFAQHHLNVTLELRPVSPSLVGSVVYMDESAGAPAIDPITKQGACFTPGGGSDCPIGVTIPAGFHGQADIEFGRAARPGERYVSTGSAFTPGEAMHGMSIKGKRVAQVVAELQARHVTVADFNQPVNGISKNVHKVPGNWYVYDAVPWAPGQVMLFVGPTAHEVVPSYPDAPVPTRTAAAAN